MNRVAAGRMTRITPLVRIGTTTTQTIATTILACGWLCPRIDVLVNSWTRVFAVQKRRCCMEPPPSMAVLKRVSVKIITSQLLFLELCFGTKAGSQGRTLSRSLRGVPPSVAVLNRWGRRGRLFRQPLKTSVFQRVSLNFFCDVFNKSFIFIDLLKTQRASEKIDRVFSDALLSKKKKSLPLT